jgi:pyruvate, water dikinase
MATLVTRTVSAPADLEPIRRFSDLSSADVPYAGAEGAGLGELTRTGLPVAPGFVVAAPAREIPAWVADAIETAYGDLCHGQPDVPVAVRSSAAVEAIASTSSGGLNGAFLNVVGSAAVLDAVTRCWKSLFDARTIYCRAQRGFSQTEMGIAVVVQRQIASTRAGVTFTTDPVSGRRDHLVIEGSFGLREAVVSGRLSPDRYVVEKSTMSVLVRSIRSKPLAIEVARNGGTIERELDAEESGRAALSDDEVLRVAELGIAIEREYGRPQDIEWAFDPDGSIWMLQSRPIAPIGRRDVLLTPAA